MCSEGKEKTRTEEIILLEAYKSEDGVPGGYCRGLAGGVWRREKWIGLAAEGSELGLAPS